MLKRLYFIILILDTIIIFFPIKTKMGDIFSLSQIIKYRDPDKQHYRLVLRNLLCEERDPTTKHA